MLHFLTKSILLLLLCNHLLHAYSYEMHCDKKELIVGEKAQLTLTLRYHNLEDYSIDDADFADFKTKLFEDNATQEDNNTWCITKRYTLTALAEGNYTLTSPTAHIESIAPQYQTRYNRNKYLIKADIHANPSNITVTALPQGLKITGNYILSTEVDTQRIKSGEPVHFTLHLRGEGNLDNLDFFTLDIPNTTVYETASTPTQKSYDIVSSSNYTIPPILLKYYNQNTQTPELLATPAYPIIVSTPPIAKKSKIVPQLVLLLLFTTLLYYLYHLFDSLAYLDKKAIFIKGLKQCKSSETLLAKVAPYLGKDRGLDRLIFKLEDIEGEEFVRVKREIVKNFKHHV